MYAAATYEDVGRIAEVFWNKQARVAMGGCLSGLETSDFEPEFLEGRYTLLMLLLFGGPAAWKYVSRDGKTFPKNQVGR